jgi:hypothetical protein
MRDDEDDVDAARKQRQEAANADVVVREDDGTDHG